MLTSNKDYWMGRIRIVDFLARTGSGKQHLALLKKSGNVSK
jgi:hypothetical protein